MDRRPDGRRGQDHVVARAGSCPSSSSPGTSRNDETEPKTSPEELLAAAHASCFAMQLAHGLIGAGWDPEVITVTAKVSFEIGIGITDIALVAQVESDGLPDEILRDRRAREGDVPRLEGARRRRDHARAARPPAAGGRGRGGGARGRGARRRRGGRRELISGAAAAGLRGRRSPQPLP